MGDPRKVRKKYETPRHPWVGSRIAEEKRLKYAYGLKNKKEAWRMATTLKRFKDRAKRLFADNSPQATVEQQQLLSRMTRLGLIKQGAGFEAILGLPIEAVMDRRLQTILLKKHLARTPKQARQMITHRHITVGGKVVTSPSYLVSLDEEATVGFVSRSAFANEQHPERFSEEELLRKKQKEEAKQKKEKVVDEEIATFDEKAIEQAEVLVGEKKVESVEEIVTPTTPAEAEETPAEQKAEETPEAEAPAEQKAEKPEEKPAAQEAAKSKEDA